MGAVSVASERDTGEDMEGEVALPEGGTDGPEQLQAVWTGDAGKGSGPDVRMPGENDPGYVMKDRGAV